MKNEWSKNFPGTILAVIILLVGAWYLMGDSMNTYPAYIHAWTQTDRLALAQNFQENGFDFFHPATYSLLTKEGITQVDFPIHDYLVACISSFLKKDVVSVFRAYNLLYSLFGLFFFFQLSLLLTKSAARSVFATAFLFTLPFFVYYQNGFLPSVPSFSNFIIGLYFIFKSNRQAKLVNYALAIVFFTLAALARAPFIIFLVAVLLMECFFQLKWKKFNWQRLVIPLFGLGLFLGYNFYNRYLAENYGSMFLADTLSFKSVDHFLEIMSLAADRWGDQLLSPYHGILLTILLITVLWQLNKRLKLNYQIRYLALYFLLSSFGVMLFFLAFGQQFADHDYYYIDTFLPLLALLLLIALARLEIPSKWYTLTATLCGIFFFYFFSYAKEIQEKRYTPPFNDRVEYAYSNYKNSSNDLKEWGINKGDTLLVLEANSTNMPFTIWGNRGYTVLSSSPMIVEGKLDSNFSYAVLIDSFFISDSYRNYPSLINQLTLVHTNDLLSIYKKSSHNKPSDFFEKLLFEGHSNFDDYDNLADSITAWTPEEEITSSYGKSLKIQPINEYTLSIKLKPKHLLKNKPIHLLFVGEYYPEDSVKVQVVLRMNDYYGVNYLENQLNELNVWQKLQYHYKIDPSYFKQNNELTFYFWNPHKNQLFVDNVNLIIYQ